MWESAPLDVVLDGYLIARGSEPDREQLAELDVVVDQKDVAIRIHASSSIRLALSTGSSRRNVVAR